MSDPTVVDADLGKLAPLFRSAVSAALAAANDPARAGGMLDAKVYEAYRSPARQAWLYAQGRTRPGAVVTHAATSLTSWHGYGLAVDVVHRVGFWRPFGDDAVRNAHWFEEAAALFKAHGCNWGGDWTSPDTPHMQWGRCPASPTDLARLTLAQGGVTAVWRTAGAQAQSALA